MNDIPGYLAAQRQYDAQMPPDDESCEVECVLCEGNGKSTCDEVCPACDGTGKVECHAWRRIRSNSEGNCLLRCKRCGAEEVE